MEEVNPIRWERRTVGRRFGGGDCSGAWTWLRKRKKGGCVFFNLLIGERARRSFKVCFLLLSDREGGRLYSLWKVLGACLNLFFSVKPN